jgi:hypothetical protein
MRCRAQGSTRDWHRLGQSAPARETLRESYYLDIGANTTSRPNNCLKPQAVRGCSQSLTLSTEAEAGACARPS